jgi:hypothetical protein
MQVESCTSEQAESKEKQMPRPRKGEVGGARLDVLEDVGNAVLLLALSVHFIRITNLRMP